MKSFLVKLAARVGRWSVLRLRQREKTQCVNVWKLRLQGENVSSEFQKGT